VFGFFIAGASFGTTTSYTAIGIGSTAAGSEA